MTTTTIGRPPTAVPDATWRTVKAYAADWDLFTTWCAATGRTPLPAAPGTVTVFLADNPAAPATCRRRVTAINHAHRRDGYLGPGEHRQVRALLARPAPESRDRADPGVVAAAVRRIPVAGWPTGMFGRRDALLLLLRCRAGLTYQQLVDLTTDHLALTAAGLQITTTTPGGGSSSVTFPVGEDPRVCPGCVWMRWLEILHPATEFASAWTFRAILRTPESDGHHCDHPVFDIRSVRSVPVFMPVDRWGALPLPLRATTVRTAIALTGQHLIGSPPTHPVVVDPDGHSEAGDSLSSARPERVEVVRVDPAVVHREGLAARARALMRLAEVNETMDTVDRAAAELEQRIQELMSGADELHRRLNGT